MVFGATGNGGIGGGVGGRSGLTGVTTVVVGAAVFCFMAAWGWDRNVPNSIIAF